LDGRPADAADSSLTRSFHDTLPMDFSISDDQRAIREGVGAVVRKFDDAYWLARD
jgi:hypothetical protein